MWCILLSIAHAAGISDMACKYIYIFMCSCTRVCIFLIASPMYNYQQSPQLILYTYQLMSPIHFISVNCIIIPLVYWRIYIYIADIYSPSIAGFNIVVFADRQIFTSVLGRCFGGVTIYIGGREVGCLAWVFELGHISLVFALQPKYIGPACKCRCKVGCYGSALATSLYFTAQITLRATLNGAKLCKVYLK